MKKIIFVLVSLLSLNSFAQPIPSPKTYLGYPLGTRFTHHHTIIDYVHTVAKASNQVSILPYGETNEHRPLLVAVVSSPENMDNLEAIRISNLQRAGMAEGSPTQNKAIVWLSYNVHGNEASSSEAMMQTLYTLANTENKEVQAWLKNTVVILDPCINPDGRERYINYFTQTVGSVANPNLDSREHNEVWPGGRQNHYLFDLNRDWAWQTQVESIQRIALYNKWLPHVHVDYHEQYVENPYYFAPAAAPYHKAISPWQSEFQKRIGKNHAKYFDKNGWLYFTKEVFDLLYPSYGDTYPIFNGAIGMTYEQAGHGRGGLQALLQNGDTLKLTDRVAHHFTTGLSTVEVASANADKLLSEFEQFYKKPANFKYKSYVITETNPQKLKSVTELLDKNKIIYGRLSESRKITGYDYQKGGQITTTVAKGSLVVTTNQPKKVLVTVLFEPHTTIVDSLTYDITAWSLPYNMGVPAMATTSLVPTTTWESPTFTANTNTPTYALVWQGKSWQSVALAAQAEQAGVKVRVADEPFSTASASFERGSFLVLKADNKSNKNYIEQVVSISNKLEIPLFKVTTGLSIAGKDLGSDNMRLLHPAKVAIVAGNGVSPTSFGELWFFFDQLLHYQVATIRTDYINQVNLWDYNVLVLTNGYYRGIDESKRKELKRWVADGGKLVLIERALRSFVDKEPFGLVSKYKQDSEEPNEKPVQETYANRERKSIEDFIPGAIYKTKMDATHPLAYGYASTYFTLKQTSQRYALLEDGWNVAVLPKGTPVNGFAGHNTIKKLENSLVMGVEEVGNGSVIYFVDDPLFRAFWQAGYKAFANAVFVTP